MKKLHSILVFLFLTLCVGVNAQEKGFTQKVEQIKKRIDSITQAEKELLKKEILLIEEKAKTQQISDSLITKMKLEVAEKSSKTIKEKVKSEKEKLDILVSERVNQQIKRPRNKVHSKFTWKSGEEVDTILIRKEIKKIRGSRTRGGLNFAIGFYGLNTEDGSKNKFKIWGSRSIELGYSRNVRILKDNNLLHFNYGLSYVWNQLKMKGDDYFSVNNGATTIEPYGKSLEYSKFRANYLTLPFNLDFDFTSPVTRKDKIYYPIKEDFRFGFGGYIGILTTNKQIIEYNSNGSEINDTKRGGFHVNQWIYGVSAHFGYGTSVFYFKYNLTPLFEDKSLRGYPFSVGIRFGG